MLTEEAIDVITETHCPVTDDSGQYFKWFSPLLFMHLLTRESTW